MQSADIGRMQRQQWFINALLKKMQTPEMIVKIPQLIEIASKYIKTDMNFYDLSRLAAFAKSVNPADIQRATLPGGPSRFGHVSYWVLDTEKTQEIIDRLIYREPAMKKDSPLTVSILYASELADKFSDIQTNLEKAGYTVACNGQTRNPHTQIIAHSSYATINDAQIFKRNIPELGKAQFIISPNNYECAKSDFTIVLANNES